MNKSLLRLQEDSKLLGWEAASIGEDIYTHTVTERLHAYLDIQQKHKFYLLLQVKLCIYELSNLVRLKAKHCRS
jgi:hypothetical protein